MCLEQFLSPVATDSQPSEESVSLESLARGFVAAADAVGLDDAAYRDGLVAALKNAQASGVEYEDFAEAVLELHPDFDDGNGGLNVFYIIMIYHNQNAHRRLDSDENAQG